MFKFNDRFVRRAAPLAVIALGMSLLMQSAASAAPTPVGLGTATSFGILAGAGITNTGPTTITGDTGTFPTPSETGFYGPAPDSVTFLGGGVDHAADAVTQEAKADLLTAYNDAAGRLPVVAHAVELGGDTLTPGVYSNGTFGLTGTLTLDFQNDVTASFIFKTASTLITAVDSSVVMVNADANAACRITWKIGSSATFNTGTQFKGDVLVKDSITANTGATFIGRLLARDGAVTLDTNTIDRGNCVAVAATTTTTTTSANGNNSGGSPATTATPTSTTSTTSTPNTTATTPTTVVSERASMATPPTVVPDIASSATPPTADSSSVAPPRRTGRAGPGRPVPLPPTPGNPNVPDLPRTGGNTSSMAMFGAALMLAGSLMLMFERRRRFVPIHSS
jgi:LPXTG-motif cell wall-anchored protein